MNVTRSGGAFERTRLARLVLIGLLAMPLGARCIGGERDPCLEGPWPFWGRTSTRVGNTDTIGPQTPRIEWSVLFSTHGSESIREASPVMDDVGRVFVGTAAGMTAIDSIGRNVIWEVMPGDEGQAAALWQGRVLWADAAPFSSLYCYDAATGKEIWTFSSEGWMYFSPVVSPDGIVFHVDGGKGVLYARYVSDGCEVWARSIGSDSFHAPSLTWPSLLTVGGGPAAFDLVAVDPVTGDELWSFPTDREVFGTDAHHNGRVYVGSWDRYLYCIDAATGEEIWRFWCEQINRGAVAIGHDGTIYTATIGNEGILFAVSPAGEELWRFYPNGVVFNSPVVGGDGTIYLCSQWPPHLGWVQAVRPDGTELWTRQMPDQVSASPMVAPDGTLYIVCRDKYLYAFKDSNGDLNNDGVVNAADLAILLGAWGSCRTLPNPCPEDLNGDGEVNAADLARLLGAWGPA